VDVFLLGEGGTQQPLAPVALAGLGHLPAHGVELLLGVVQLRGKAVERELDPL
jgi:hypothetical protein